MAKQVLKVTDFKGGVNSLADARDIEDNQFAQNWNASLDKTGIVRYSGGGIQNLFNLPHDNANQVNGFGLFRFTTDYSFNMLNSDFNVGVERGTLAAVGSATSVTLEDTDSDYITQDYYKDMTLFIYSGPGAGMSREITAYSSSGDRVATIDSFTGVVSFQYTTITTIDADGGTPEENEISAAWTASTTYTNVPMHSTENNGTGCTIDVVTDSSGKPTLTIRNRGNGYALNDWIMFREPGDLAYVKTNINSVVLTTASKYIIFPWKPDSTYFGSRETDGDAFTYNVDWITDGSSEGNPIGVDAVAGPETGDYYLASTVNKMGDDTYSDAKNNLGYIEYEKDNDKLTIKPGVNYTLSFDCRAYRRWYNYVSNGGVNGTTNGSDQVPFVYLHNDHATIKKGLQTNGEKPYFVDTAGSPSYDNLQANLIVNGDFASGVPSHNGTANGWTEVDSTTNLTVTEVGSNANASIAATCYGGDEDDTNSHDGTAELESLIDFTFGEEPSSYIKTAATNLIEDTPYQLNFVYASADGIAYSVYDTTGSTYLIPWTTRPGTGGISSYKYVNEETDDFEMFGKKQTKYVNFIIPLNTGTTPLSGTARAIEIRFAPIKHLSKTRLAGVVLKKAVCDLNTMSFFGSGANPFLENRITQWSTYTLKFRLPEIDDDGTEMVERDDWEFRIYGGLATHRNGSINSEDRQSVYFDNIRLTSEETDTITLLNDNKSTGSSIGMYSASSGSWETKFIQWNGLNSQPNYNYVNGMLKISDGNFANNNENFLVYRYDRTFMHKYYDYGWSSQKYTIPSAPNTFITSQSADGISGTVFDCIPYINKLYEGLEYMNANRPYNAGYLNNEGHLVRGVQTNSSTKWEFGRFTNWDMDDIAGEGILHRYAYFNYNKEGGDNYRNNNNLDIPEGFSGQSGQKGYKNSENITADVEIDDSGVVTELPSTTNVADETVNDTEADENFTFYRHSALHAMNRGFRSNSNEGHGLEAGWAHNPISFWIQGEDTVNQADDISSTVGAGKKVSSLEFDFTHEFITSRRYGAQNNTNMKTGGMTYYRIRAWKIDSSVITPQTDAMVTLGDDEEGNAIKYNNISNQSITYQQLAADSFGLKDGTDGGTDSVISYFPIKDGTLKDIYIGKNDFDAGLDFTSDNFSQDINIIWEDKIDDQHATKGDIRVRGEITWEQDAGVTSDDDIFVTIEECWQHYSRYSRCFSYRLDDVAYTKGDSDDSGIPRTDFDALANFARYSKIIMNTMDLHFYDDDYDENTSNQQSFSDDTCQVNFNFGTPTGVDAAGWGERIFRLATSSVNLFDEESGLNENKSQEIGASGVGAGTISLGHSPGITVHISSSILRDKFKTKTKFYMKGSDSDIWYLQFYVDHRTGLLYSTTSSKKVSGVVQTSKSSLMWTMPRENAANFNEVDSYEAETGVSQESAIVPNNSLLQCRYKTSVVANNRLYVGNIKQNGTVFGDRMIKSPINKYNILPSANFIDVAVNDGDEITALEFYKDRLLQFKKRKVFVINTSGDYEFLEDTFDNIGVQRQCQVTKTPMGIAWANSSGCFLYDGEKVENLIDGKLGTEAFQAQFSNNYWFISDSNIPAIGYIKSTKKLLIAKDVESHTIHTSPSMWQYDFVSKGWTFLFQKQKVQTNNTAFAPSNFINDENGDILWYTKQTNAAGDTAGLGLIYKWNDSPVTNTHANANLDNFYFSTKDYDFGNPAVRKKIYKVYVTFKAVDDNNGNGSAAYQHSKVLVKYSTNGGATFSGLFADTSTNYDATNGLNGSGTDWITAELKPSSSINNIYSFQLQFIGATTNIPNRFEINDFSIVYRIKSVK